MHFSTSSCLFSAASLRGVLPYLSLFTFAPCFNNQRTWEEIIGILSFIFPFLIIIFIFNKCIAYLWMKIDGLIG